MRPIFFALDWAAQPAYVLLAVIAVWYLYKFLQARSEVSSTYFELERDLARQRQAGAVTVIIVMIEIAVLFAGVQLRAVPFLETERDMDTVALAQSASTQDVPFATPTTGDLSNAGLGLEVPPPLGIDDDVIVLTPTPTSTPVGTIVPNAPSIEGCESPEAQLEVPANGQRVFAPLVVRGTAFTENFAQAKIEVSGPSTFGNFTVAGNVSGPVREVDVLSQFQPSLYGEGAYEFRLMVFDISANLVASCLVTIYITDPPFVPTPTPSGG